MAVFDPNPSKRLSEWKGQPIALLDGQIPDSLRHIYFVCVRGGSCVGKSRLQGQLVKLGKCVVVEKCYVRDLRPDEITAETPLDVISTRELSRLTAPRFEGNFSCSPTPAWWYWASALGIGIPSDVEIGSILDQFWTVILLEKIRAACIKAEQEGKVPMISLHKRDADAFRRYFPNTSFISLSCDPLVRRKRMEERYGGLLGPFEQVEEMIDNPSEGDRSFVTSRVANTVRCYDGVSTVNVESQPDIRIDTSDPVNDEDNMRRVLEYIGQIASTLEVGAQTPTSRHRLK